MMTEIHERLSSNIRVYAGLSEHIAGFDEDLDVTAALLRRDRIELALRDGARPDGEHRELLGDADERLRHALPQLVTQFPWLFEGDHPPDFWWWHPQMPAGARSI